MARARRRTPLTLHQARGAYGVIAALGAWAGVLAGLAWLPMVLAPGIVVPTLVLLNTLLAWKALATGSLAQPTASIA